MEMSWYHVSSDYGPDPMFVGNTEYEVFFEADVCVEYDECYSSGCIGSCVDASEANGRIQNLVSGFCRKMKVEGLLDDK